MLTQKFQQPKDSQLNQILRDVWIFFCATSKHHRRVPCRLMRLPVSGDFASFRPLNCMPWLTLPSLSNWGKKTLPPSYCLAFTLFLHSYESIRQASNELAYNTATLCPPPPSCSDQHLSFIWSENTGIRFWIVCPFTVPRSYASVHDLPVQLRD